MRFSPSKTALTYKVMVSDSLSILHILKILIIIIIIFANIPILPYIVSYQIW